MQDGPGTRTLEVADITESVALDGNPLFQDSEISTGRQVETATRG